MIRSIIFDWGGVLAPADTEIAARRLSGVFGCSFSKLKEKIGEYEQECSDSADYLLFLKKIEIEFGIPKEELMKALVEISVWDGFHVAKRLAGRSRLCILSDQMQFKADHIKQNNNLSFFDHVLFSCEIGAQKPSKKAFQVAIGVLQERPEHCLFIDDKIENVIAAKTLGFNVIHCADVSLLEKEIKKFL